MAQQIVIRHFYTGDAVRLFRVEITDDMRRKLIVRIPLDRLKHFDAARINLMAVKLHQIRLCLSLVGKRRVKPLFTRFCQRGKRLGRRLYRGHQMRFFAHERTQLAIINNPARAVHAKYKRALRIGRG